MSQTEHGDLARFLTTLWPELPEKTWMCFWSLPKKRSEWVQAITPETLTMLERWAEKENVYFAVCLRSQNLGPTLRGEKSDCVALPGLYLDIDYGTEHQKPNLPPTEKEALQLLAEMGPKPTLVVHSGHGLQAWWAFKEPWILDSDEERGKAEQLTKGWCSTLRGRAKERGWDADPVGDLPRVMRLPGLWNRKSVPIRTKLLSLSEMQYNRSDFESYLLPELIESPKTAKIDWKISKHPQAEPPSQKFLLLCESDAEFKRLCLRIPRPGQQDLSPSGFDFQLARLAFAAHWSGQEIANLMISQRRNHGCKLKLEHPTYYDDTLTNALSEKDEESRRQLIEELKAGHSPGGSGSSNEIPANGHHVDKALVQKSFPLTDAGNAEHFAARFGDRVRYDHRRTRWLLWQSPRWCPDLDAEIRRLAKASVRCRFKDAVGCGDLDERTRLAKWALQSESRTKLEALLTLAQAETPIADAGENWDPDPLFLCASNGVIDLRTGQLRGGQPEDRLTMSTAIPFESSARCPRWEQFLGEIFGDDQALIGFIRRAIGYSLTGQTGEQCWFLCYGTGANGKSTFVNTLRYVLGDYAWNMPFSTLELHQRASIPNDLAPLVGRRFVVASETNDGTRLNESRIKMMTGEEPITARFLHQEFFTFPAVSKLWLSVNHKPIVQDDSPGFWRRVRLIPFCQHFPIDQTLGARLKQEGEGILAWAVRGCLEWQQRDGLHPPIRVTDATTAYSLECDPLADFLENGCIVKPTVQTRADDLYKGYRRWAMEQGLSEKELLSGTRFGRRMKQRFDSHHTRKGLIYTGVSPRAFEGVKFLPDTDEKEFPRAEKEGLVVGHVTG